jgi:hypothetical protein
MQTSLDWFLENLPERFKNAILNSCQEEIKQAKQMEKEQMIDFYTWIRKNDSAEEYFHYSDQDMLEQYLSGDWGPGWRDLSEDLNAPTCEYSGLRPVDGYIEKP